jgi:hypothetical protein
VSLSDASQYAGAKAWRLVLSAIVLFSCAPVGEAAPVDTSFEAPVHQVGKKMDATDGWIFRGADAAENGGGISAERSFVGSQSLKVASGTVVERAPFGGDVRYYDLEVLPVFAEETAGRVSFSGGVLAFLKDGSVGKIVAYGGGKESLVLRDEVELGAGSTGGWLRITVRIDVGKKQWDLFLDGKPAKAGIALTETQAGFLAEAPQEGPVFLDDFLESAENPLFEDADKDGMPDAEEAVYGLNPGINDREADLDGDGIPNVQEFFEGTAFGRGDQLVGAFLFVDNLNGDDANSGKTSQLGLGTEGPKASIRAAMAAAPDGATIVVMRGSGVYVEGSRNAGGKRLTIKTVAPVTIR